jgi:hypothetical protein
LFKGKSFISSRKDTKGAVAIGMEGKRLKSKWKETKDSIKGNTES